MLLYSPTSTVYKLVTLEIQNISIDMILLMSNDLTEMEKQERKNREANPSWVAMFWANTGSI